MTGRQRLSVSIGASALVLALSLSAPATAQQVNKPNAAARVLAHRVDAAIVGLGCGASVATYESAIQSAIATSGQDPIVVQASLALVLSQPGLCPEAKEALTAVDNVVLAALRTDYYATSGGPGPGTPIGPPDPISAGTSDYDPPP